MTRDWKALDLESYLYLTANGLDTADHPAAAEYEDLYQYCRAKVWHFEFDLEREISLLRHAGEVEMAADLETKLAEWITENRTPPLVARLSQPWTPLDNVGLITAWVKGEQVGSLTYGKPMTHREIATGADWVLGQIFVVEGRRRIGAASKMLDCFWWTVGTESKVTAEYSPDGQLLFNAYSQRTGRWNIGHVPLEGHPCPVCGGHMLEGETGCIACAEAHNG